MKSMGNIPAVAAFRVLVVDSDVDWSAQIAHHLRPENVSVVVAEGCHDVMTVVEDISPQLIILDLDLPGDDKLETCRRLRAVSDAYLVVMSARCDEAMTIAGLAAGADDVLTKPVSSRAAAARVHAIARRHRASRSPAPSSRGGESSKKCVFGPLSVDIIRREVFIADQQIQLTRIQFEILSALARRPGRVTTRQELVNSVWGPSWSGSPNTIDVHIGQLRRRLGDDLDQPILVVNERGKGFRLAG